MPDICCIDWQALGAVGTMLAVVVALIAPFLRQWILKPKLRLSFEPEMPYVRKSTDKGRGIAPPDYWFYARLMVANQGNYVANQVEVYVNEVKKEGQPGQYELIGCDPGALKWANVGQRTLSQLPPKAQMLVDFGHIVDPVYRSTHVGEQVDEDDPMRTLFTLDIQVTQKTKEHILEPGRYMITLHCQAANAKPHRQVVELDLDSYGDFALDARSFFGQHARISLTD